MKKLLLLIFAICLLSSSYAFAGKEEKVKEILKLMHQDKQINSILNQQLFIPVECSFVIPETERGTIRKEIRNSMNIKGLTEPIVQFWAERYTEAELDDLIRFYKTPIGQKTIKVQEELTLFFPEHLQKWMEGVTPSMKDVVENLQKKYSQRSGNEVQACIQKLKQ